MAILAEISMEVLEKKSQGSVEAACGSLVCEWKGNEGDL